MNVIKKNKTSTNFVFYTAYQVLIYLIPFVISPFLTRTLKENTLGIFTFSNTIVTYFVLLANLGIAKFGQREISRAKDDKNKVFWNLLLIHICLSIFSLLVFSILLVTIFRSQISIYSFCLLYIVSALFDVTWLFYGRENFKIVTVINGIYALIKMGLIFLIVRNPDQLFVYQLLYYGAFLLSNVTIFLIALKFVGKPKFDLNASFKYLKPLLFFSLTVVAITLYTVFDKTIIGLFLEKSEVAYYEYANKIIAIPQMLLLTIGTVLFPKMCSLETNNETEKSYQIHKISLFFSISIGVGAIFGLIALGKPLVSFYYGDNFAKSGEYIVYMSPLILIITLGDIFRMQFIIPKKMDKFYLLSVSLSAILNLIISLILIKPLGVLGVIIGTLVAETFGCVFQIIYCRKFTSLKRIVLYLVVFAVFAAIMFFSIKGFNHLINISEPWKSIILALIGVLIYGVLVGLAFIFERKHKWR